MSDDLIAEAHAYVTEMANRADDAGRGGRLISRLLAVFLSMRVASLEREVASLRADRGLTPAADRGLPQGKP